MNREQCVQDSAEFFHSYMCEGERGWGEEILEF